MAHDEHGGELRTAHSSEASVNSGTALKTAEGFENPGLPEHRHRVTDDKSISAKRVERAVVALFIVSMLGSIFAIAAYFIWPINREDITSVRGNTMFIGIGIAAALLSVGFGTVMWAKYLMKDEELAESRHSIAGSPATRARAVEIFKQANEESGFGRRTLLRNTLIGAAAVIPLPGVLLLRDLYNTSNEYPPTLLEHTMWAEGVRLVHDPTGRPIKAADVTMGSAFHVIPEGLTDLQEGKLEEKAKAVVLVMRLPQDRLKISPEREGWDYDGIVAYSKVCTHVGCPVALYEQQTHHLLCPCHQSQFDVTDHCKVIFGPAGRPLPQLPITVDSEGYLVAQSDFHEPVGPTFWERRNDYLD